MICTIIENTPFICIISDDFNFLIGVQAGKFIFSDKVVAQWKKAEEDKFGHDPVMLKWARDGGKFPPV